MGITGGFVGAQGQGPLRILLTGAHPDDVDLLAGGLAALYARAGHHVKAVSITNGATGHHEMGGVPLARRRRAEAAAAGRVLGIDYEVLDFPDGALQPDLPARDALVRLIRAYQPDLVLTNRPYDYHPDHRSASQLITDAICMATVPNVVSDVPYLVFTPALFFSWDDFHRPCPFRPDIVIGIDPVIEQKADAIACHESQVFEFLPYIKHIAASVPADAAARRAWLLADIQRQAAQLAERYRERLQTLYGKAAGQALRYAEAFELSEYGAPLTDALRQRLFPFFSEQS